MDSLYSVVVRLGMDSSGFAGAAGLAMGVLQKLEQRATAAGTSTAALGKSLGLVAGGMALLGAGAVGVGILKDWVGAAGQMQDALVQVGIAASGTKAQLQDLYNQSFAVANQTQYQGADVLQMDQVMARMGFRDPSGKQTQRQVIGEAVPLFARAAEIAQHFQKTGYEETVTALTQQAHMFGSYSGKALAQNVAWATGAGLVSHMTGSQQANVLRYLVPSLKSGQLDTLDALSLAALGNQTGLTMGKGGSNIGTLLRQLAPNGSRKHDQALAEIEHLAGGRFYRDGKAIPLPDALRLLNRFYDSDRGTHARITPEQLGVIAKTALLVQGSQASAVLGNDTSIAQFAAIRAQIASYTPQKIEGIQGQVNAPLPGQLATLSGNLGSIRTLLGTQLLPIITPVVHGFVDLTGGIVGFLSHHKDIAEMVALFAAVATAAALIGGPVLIAAGAIGLMSAAGITLAGVGAALSAAFLPVTLTVVGVAAAVAAVVLVTNHWSTIIGALTGKLGLAWQVIAVGTLTVGGFVAGMSLANLAMGAWGTIVGIATVASRAWAVAQVAGSAVAGVATAAYGLLDAAVMALSGGVGIAAVASGALGMALGAASAVAGIAAGAYGLLDATVGVLSGGFSIAAIAAGALDIALAPVTLIALGVAAAIGAVVLVATHWGDAMDLLQGKFGWFDKLPGWGKVVAGALIVAFSPLIAAIEAVRALVAAYQYVQGLFQPGNHGAASAATAAVAAARANDHVIAQQAHRYTQAHGWETAQHGYWQYQHLVQGKGMQWVNDGRLPAAHPAVAHHTSATIQNTHTTRHTSTSTHDARHTSTHVQHTQAAPQRGGDVHIHVAAGAVTTHVHPAPGHDHGRVTDSIAERGAEGLARALAARLAGHGLLPSTTRPTLHQLS